MTKLIKVRAVSGVNRVALHEKNPLHPKGEVFLVGNDPRVHVVADTELVRRAVLRHQLVLVTAEAAAPPSQSQEEDLPMADIDGIDVDLAMTLADRGLRTADDVLNFVNGGGTYRTLAVRGIGEGRFRQMVEWASDQLRSE